MFESLLIGVCFLQNLAYEIILTLGQAFEVAYQLALQARKSGHGSSTLPESFDSKPSKPVPKPRVNIRKSVSEFCLFEANVRFYFHLDLYQSHYS